MATDRFRRDRAAPFVRAATSFLIANATGGFADRIAKQLYGDDPNTISVTKAVVNPTTTASFTSTATADFVGVMGNAYASASLLADSVQVQLVGGNVISVPGCVSDPNNASFVQEGTPIPVRALSLTGAALSLRKFATVVPFAREIFEHSTPSIEAIVRAVLLESLGLATDAALFSNTAGSAIRPAGLLNGISPIAHSTATNADDAMVADVKALVSAVTPIAGNGDVTLVAASDQAVALRLRQRRETYQVLASSALTAGTVIAIAPNGLASAIDPVPRFEVASEAALVMDDAAGPISTVGTPNVVAAPARSLFQTDTLALRIILQVSWGLRSSSAIAYVTGVTW